MGGCSSVGRASDQHATEVGSISPVLQGIFIPEPTFGADSFTVSVRPRVQPHSLKSVRT